MFISSSIDSVVDDIDSMAFLEGNHFISSKL